MALNGKLSHPQRLITTHNSEGKAILSDMSSPAPFYALGSGDALFAQAYVTSGFPTTLASDADLSVYKHYLSQPPGITVSNGTVLRYVDMPPGATSPMHRTVSLDYGVVLDGEVELVLDSGETQVMKRGDVCVQRATMHAWRNMSQTEWARMLYILQPVQAFSVAGEEVKEDYGGMKNVKASE
jgi:quercetin dioxygenase-like cupin family protein